MCSFLCKNLGVTSLPFVCTGRFACQVTGRITKNLLLKPQWDMWLASGTWKQHNQIIFFLNIQREKKLYFICEVWLHFESTQTNCNCSLSSKTFGVETKTLSMYDFYFFPLCIELYCKVDHMNNQRASPVKSNMSERHISERDEPNISNSRSMYSIVTHLTWLPLDISLHE